MILGHIDIALFKTLNDAFAGDALHNQMVASIGNTPMIRGFPVFFFLVALWFSNESVTRRGRMLAGLLATCVATVASVWLQYHITLHIRPLLDPSLNMKSIDARAFDEKWERLGSFPSDTATLYFSISTVIFLENRRAGAIAFLWSLITVGVIRVAMGYHYASDVVGAFLLGPGCVYLFTKIRHLRLLFERALQYFKPRIYIVHALFFIFLADAYNVFEGLQGIGHGAQAAIAHL